MAVSGLSSGGSVSEELQHRGTIELGNLRARIVEDAQGRQCAAIMLGNKELLFTISQLLMMRELLDASLKALTRYAPAEPPLPNAM